jgi:hypothetical protein
LLLQFGHKLSVPLLPLRIGHHVTFRLRLDWFRWRRFRLARHRCRPLLVTLVAQPFGELRRESSALLLPLVRAVPRDEALFDLGELPLRLYALSPTSLQYPEQSSVDECPVFALDVLRVEPMRPDLEVRHAPRYCPCP